MGALIDYWYYTGDTKWNAIAQEGLLFQIGDHDAFMPPNQTMTEGNDDQASSHNLDQQLRTILTYMSQGFWGMAALSAAEYNFPDPPPNQPQWLALAQAVFNTQATRWDTSSCNGGLRWQIFQWNNGFNYKNSISQACFFNIAARLALYTRNETYAVWATRVWDWMMDTQFMTEDAFYIYDGAHVEDNCTNLTPYQWTYNAGAFLLGAAAMYNYTADYDPETSQVWRNRTDGLLHGTAVFFTGEDKNIMTEVACESVRLCDLDQQSFKAYLSRWMAATTKWAPWTFDYAKQLLDASATAAAKQCTGGENGRMCGLMWANNSGQWDGTTGVGQQMAAMEVVLATIIQGLDAPMTGSTGGTSVGNPNAGTTAGSTDEFTSLESVKPISQGAVAGAYILTIAAIILLLGGIWFVLRAENNDRTHQEKWRGPRDGVDSRGRPRVRKEKNVLQRETILDRREGTMRLDGHSTPHEGRALQEASTTNSVSIYSDQGGGPSVTISRVDAYPNKQPWRRPPREGDYAGAVDPNRGNGAGFGMLDLAAPQEVAAPSSSSSGVRGSRLTDIFMNSWVADADGARELTAKTTMKLQKKPLPGRPGLGRKLQEQELGDGKVWGTLV